MNYILPVVIGFFVAAPGIMLPGLLNITAAKISLQKGRKRGLIFAVGATLIIFIQSYIAVTFAKYINNRPDIIYMLEEVALGIFTVLTIYFFFFAKTPKNHSHSENLTDRRSAGGDFFMGVMLSSLNFLPVPYYVFISIALGREKYFYFEPISIFLFVIGAVTSSFIVFYLYILFFQRFEHKTDKFLAKMNNVLGTVTLLVAIVTLIKIIRGG